MRIFKRVVEGARADGAPELYCKRPAVRCMSDEPEDEARAFREAMRDVRRLKRAAAKDSAPVRPPPRARFTRADQQEVLRESLLPPADEAMLDTGDELSFRRPHVPEAVLVKLRRGHFTVDAEIDLHGLTGAEA